MRGSSHCTLLVIGILTGVTSIASLPVEGRLRLPGTGSSELTVTHTNCAACRMQDLCCAVFADKSIKSSKIKLVLSINGGSELQAFPTIDGSFLFPDVPAGTHMLDVISVDLHFPQVYTQSCLFAAQQP